MNAHVKETAGTDEEELIALKKQFVLACRILLMEGVSDRKSTRLNSSH